MSITIHERLILPKSQVAEPSTVEDKVVFRRTGKGGRKVLVRAKKLPTRRIPRLSKLMALAIRFEGLVRTGYAQDYAELARLGGVTRARITQIMNLLLLAPQIQEEILFLPEIEQGRDKLVLRMLQPISQQLDWRVQLKAWKLLLSRKTS
jgi:hypothetical protein